MNVESNLTISVPTLDSSSLTHPQQATKNTKGRRELSHLDKSSIISSSGRPKRQRIEKKYSK